MRTTTAPHAPARQGSRAAVAKGGFAGFTGFYYPGGGRPGAGGAF